MARVRADAQELRSGADDREGRPRARIAGIRRRSRADRTKGGRIEPLGRAGPEFGSRRSGSVTAVSPAPVRAPPGETGRPERARAPVRESRSPEPYHRST